MSKSAIAKISACRSEWNETGVKAGWLLSDVEIWHPAGRNTTAEVGENNIKQ